MTVLCTPDGRPFLARTYLRREDLRSLTRAVKEAWVAKRAAIDKQADTLAAHVRELTAGRHGLPPTDATDVALVDGVVGALASLFDPVRGGYGTKPKFPPHAELMFLLDRAKSPEDEAFRQARRTLEAME